jgi:hypothetical protein
MARGILTPMQQIAITRCLVVVTPSTVAELVPLPALILGLRPLISVAAWQKEMKMQRIFGPSLTGMMSDLKKKAQQKTTPTTRARRRTLREILTKRRQLPPSGKSD